MPRHHAPTLQTSDTEAAAFFLASGVRLQRIEADAPRATYVFADREVRGPALRAAFAADAPIGARTLLMARRELIRGISLAREAPTRCIRGSELEAHWLAMDAENRAATRAQVTAG